MDLVEKELRALHQEGKLRRWVTPAEWAAIWRDAMEGEGGDLSEVVRRHAPDALDPNWTPFATAGQAKTLSPPMLLKQKTTYQESLHAALNDGWVMVTEGPSGAQLKAPKKMRGLDKACMALGIVTLIFYGIGLIFIGIALLDYVFFTKEETKFLARE